MVIQSSATQIHVNDVLIEKCGKATETKADHRGKNLTSIPLLTKEGKTTRQRNHQKPVLSKFDSTAAALLPDGQASSYSSDVQHSTSSSMIVQASSVVSSSLPASSVVASSLPVTSPVVPTLPPILSEPASPFKSRKSFALKSKAPVKNNRQALSMPIFLTVRTLLSYFRQGFKQTTSS